MDELKPALFKELADLLEEIRKVSSGKDSMGAKKALIIKWMQTTKATDHDFATMVLWLTASPFKKSCDKKLGVSKALLSEALCSTYEITFDGLNPLHKEYGHLGLVASFLAGRGNTVNGCTGYPYYTCGGTLEISDIRKHLIAIVEARGNSAQQRKITFIEKLLTASSPAEAILLCSIILGKMPPGVSIGEGMILDAIAEAFNVSREKAEKKYCIISGSIGTVAAVCRIDGDKGLDEIQVKVGRPLLPMLAISMRESKCESLEDALRKQPSGSKANKKYDGARIQIHKDEDTVKLFSRGLEDLTANFPEIVEAVKYVFNGNNVIADGELIIVNPETKRVLPFQHILERLQRRQDVIEHAEKHPATVKLFDILWLNGDDCIDATQQERWALLGVVARTNDQCHLADSIEVTDLDQLTKFMAQSVSEGNEGLIIKENSAPYVLKINRTTAWIKHKTMLETLDLKILNFGYGDGEMSDVIAKLELGALAIDGSYKSLGWIGSGLTDGMRAQLTLIVEFDPWGARNLPIVEVGYEELQKSTSSSSGLSMRFPRVFRLRPDKKEADTMERVLAIAGGQTRHE